MSDTTDNTPANTELSQGKAQPNPSDVEASQPNVPSSSEMVSQDQLREQLNKARQEERKKLYASLEKQKKESEALQSERDQVLQDLTQAKEKLKVLEDSTLSDMDKISQQVRLLAEQNELLKNQLNQVSEQAETRVRESELKSYRQQRIEQSGVLFPELVTGGSPEEIDASIQALQERESSVRTQIEDKIRSERAADVPRPMSPELTSNTSTVSDRYALSKLKRDEYQAMRQKLMAQAMDSVRR